MIVEICANSHESAMAAQNGGAQRIELCSELALGGITPSHGLLEKVQESLSIPVFVLIRPRSGDFTYSKSEFEVMLKDIAFAKTLGVSGIVSGILKSNGEIDKARTAELITASKGMSFTFHRAFDWVPNPEETLDIVMELGVDRVLTSGQHSNAVLGFQNLQSYLKEARGRIGILPGGGISEQNVSTFKTAGFTEVHASLSSFRESVKGSVPMYSTKTLDKDLLSYSDVERVKHFMELLK